MTEVHVAASDAVTTISPELAAALVAIVGDDAVLATDDALTEAGADWWPIGIVWQHHGLQPSLPAVVVRPSDAAQTAAVLAAASDAGVPVTPFAGRSGVCGGSLPVRGGVSLDLRGLDRIHSVDTTDLVVHVDAGVFGPTLEAELARHGVTVGHFPQSFDLATVGGWVACRGAGQFSNRYGKIEDMVLGVEVALADGSVVRTNPQPAAATGPDLAALFVGAEGTLGVVTSVWLQLWPVAEKTAKLAASFDSFADTLEALRRIYRRGARPACLRTYDGPETARHFGLADDRNALIVLAEGDPAQVDFEMQVVTDVLDGFGDGCVREDDSLVDHWLEKRNDVSALHEVVAKGIVVDTIEIAAPWSKLAGIYDAVKAALFAVSGTAVVTAHASHTYLSGACVYFTFAGIPGDTVEAKDAYYRSAWDAAMTAVHDGGGTVSHHHGIGLVRGRWLAAELGDAGHALLARVKDALDPAGVLNPGKLGLGATVWPPP